MIRSLLISLLVLAACAPVPMTRERAEADCKREVGLADGVQGNVKVGVGTGGASGGVGIVITDRIFNPQTPEEFLAECVQRKMEGRPGRTTTGIRVGAST